ncbi:MAG TPA: DUF6528 family protein [Bacteroidales bacterium]|nr:DUF6528 family protein [Bacteroidales bacterium]
MKNVKWLFAALMIPVLVSFNKQPEEIIACGDDQVLIIDKNTSEGKNVKLLWNWKVKEATDLPAIYQKLMVPTDECKPVSDDRVLIASSGGGIVLVDRKTKKSIFYAQVPMAHSAEILPGNRVAIALSTHAKGNSIEVYDLKRPEQVLFRDSLYSGHGVVWMEKQKSLYALGYNELRRYSLKDWNTAKPSLKLEEKWATPDNGGHDLSSISDSKLLLSTSVNTWVFDTGNGKFAPFEPLKGVKNVKSMNYSEATGELIYTIGEISWWTHNIYCRKPDKTIIIPDINLYKVRVNHPGETN